MNSKIIIGTRGSKLALWQANWTKDAILEIDPSLTVELDVIKTKGDKILDVSLAKVGGKGLFVKEIEEALLDKKIDLAIHSMKDMPAVIPEGLCIGAIPDRENPSDVLISNNGIKLKDLKPGSKVGTSSLRRASQLIFARQDLDIVPLRGNVDTRLRKLRDGEMDAIILAAAGVIRLGLAENITECIDFEIMLPAVGQGSLCIETREIDDRISPIVSKLDHHDTRVVVLGERAFLNRLEGGCQVPIAAHGKLKNKNLILKGLVADLDGKDRVIDIVEGPEESYEKLGIELAERLLSKGANEILERVKENG